MKRYETRVEDGVYFVEGPNDWLKVGDLQTIIELVGDETFEVEYDEQERIASWLDTDAEGTITVNVRDTLQEITFDEEFVENLAQVPYEDTNENDVPQRTEFFAEMMAKIWTSKGNMKQ